MELKTTYDNIAVMTELEKTDKVEKANIYAKIIGLHENYFGTMEEATAAALDRSLFTNRIIYIFTIDDLYMVCAHGVEKIGSTLVRRYHRGTIL